METVPSFEAQVKQRLLEHEFHPICVEATNRKKIVAKSFRKWREKNYDKWNKSLKEWKEKNKEHCAKYHKEYLDKHPGMRKAIRERQKRKKKLNALWELLTYDGQGTNQVSGTGELHLAGSQ